MGGVECPTRPRWIKGLAEGQNRPQQRFCRAAKFRHRAAAFRAAQRGQKGDKHDLRQLVPRIVRTGIGQVSKAFVEAVRRSLLSNQETPSESTSNARATPQVSYAIPVPLVGRVRVGAVSARPLFQNFTDESLPPRNHAPTRALPYCNRGARSANREFCGQRRRV